MSKAEEASQPPSYEDAMRETNTYAGASAPYFHSPEHVPLGQPGTMPSMPTMPPSTMPMGPGASTQQTIVPVPPIAAVPPQPAGAAPQGPMPMYSMPPAVTTTTVYVSPPLVGPKPCTLTCPVCHQKVRTTITVTNTGSAHAICVLLCLLGCCCCSCLPYCLSSFKITKHECPSCKSYLGSYKP